MILLIIGYLLTCVFWKWIISWGGARWIEGCKSIFFLNWLAATWNEEQIRLYALIMWIIETIWFMIQIVSIIKK